MCDVHAASTAETPCSTQQMQGALPRCMHLIRVTNARVIASDNELIVDEKICFLIINQYKSPNVHVRGKYQFKSFY